MNKHTETPRPMPGRGPKPLTAEELLALPEYVLKRFEDLTRTDDPTEVKEVFEDFIAFAPDLARVVQSLTAEVDAYREENTRLREQTARMEALADQYDAEARLEMREGDVTESINTQITADRIRAALNRGDA